jgi:Fur family transcriptional regulator, ferric uptake regulator
LNYYLDRIQSSGLKLTPRRKSIVDIFLSCKFHMTPEDVWVKLKKRFKKCGLPSVYRNLESLANCGVLTRVQKFDRKKHYGLCCSRGNHHHHHIICLKCGKVEDMSSCGYSHTKKIKGFKILSHYVQLNGICAGCLGDKK